MNTVYLFLVNKKAYIILREGKWDIPAYFGDGKSLNMHLAYLMMGLPFGVPYTLDQAYPFLQDALVALGFPDMIVEPDYAFVRLLAKREEVNADIVLGLFSALQPPENGHGGVGRKWSCPSDQNKTCSNPTPLCMGNCNLDAGVYTFHASMNLSYLEE